LLACLCVSELLGELIKRFVLECFLTETPDSMECEIIGIMAVRHLPAKTELKPIHPVIIDITALELQTGLAVMLFDARSFGELWFTGWHLKTKRKPGRY